MKKPKIKSLNKRRLELLHLSINIITKHGWSELLFKKISKNKKISYNELILMFPGGYEDMLKLSLDHLNYELEKKCTQYHLIRLPMHKRIRKIILTKINLINKQKNFFRKTFYYLFVPGNYKLMISQLYKSVDIMWYIAGDSSIDFSFYTKRVILSGIYASIILHILNNDNMLETEKKLDVFLLQVSKIPQIKNKFQLLKISLPSFFQFFRNYSY